MAIFDTECTECGFIKEVLLMGNEDIPLCSECGGFITKIMGASKFKCNHNYDPRKHGSDPNSIPGKTCNGNDKLSNRDGLYVRSKRSQE